MTIAAMDVVALVIFLGVIILAFVRKINVGILAVAAGVIAGAAGAALVFFLF